MLRCCFVLIKWKMPRHAGSPNVDKTEDPLTTYEKQPFYKQFAPKKLLNRWSSSCELYCRLSGHRSVSFATFSIASTVILILFCGCLEEWRRCFVVTLSRHAKPRHYRVTSEWKIDEKKNYLMKTGEQSLCIYPNYLMMTDRLGRAMLLSMTRLN